MGREAEVRGRVREEKRERRGLDGCRQMRDKMRGGERRKGRRNLIGEGGN